MNQPRTVFQATLQALIVIVCFDIAASFALYGGAFVLALLFFPQANLTASLVVPFIIIFLVFRIFFIRWLVQVPPQFALIRGKIIFILAIAVGLLELVGTLLIQLPLEGVLFFSISGCLITLYFFKPQI